MGELDLLREFCQHSLFAQDDEHGRAVAAHSIAWIESIQPKTDDGHSYWTSEAYHLGCRCLRALLEEPTDASRAALQEWLPPAAELLRITEHEKYWLASPLGQGHPALLCALLHGARLGEYVHASQTPRLSTIAETAFANVAS